MAKTKVENLVSEQDHSSHSTVIANNCTDPNCPHDIFGTCPVELGAAIRKGRQLKERRDRNLLILTCAVVMAGMLIAMLEGMIAMKLLEGK